MTATASQINYIRKLAAPLVHRAALNATWHATYPGGAYLEEDCAGRLRGAGIELALKRGWIKHGHGADKVLLYATSRGYSTVDEFGDGNLDVDELNAWLKLDDLTAQRIEEAAEAARQAERDWSVATATLEVAASDRDHAMVARDAAIRDAIEQGESVTAIADAAGLSRQRAYQIRDGKR